MATLGDLVDNIQAQVNRAVTVERATVKLFVEQTVQEVRNKRFDFKDQKLFLVTNAEVADYPDEETLTLETGATVYRGVLVTATDLLTKVDWKEVAKVDWIRRHGSVTFTDDDSDNEWEFTVSTDSGYILRERQVHQMDQVRSPSSGSSTHSYRWAWMHGGVRLWPPPSNNQLLELSVHRHTPISRSDLDSVDNMWTDPDKGEPLIRTLTMANLYLYWTRKPDLAAIYSQKASEIINRLETEYSQKQTGEITPWPETPDVEWL